MSEHIPQNGLDFQASSEAKYEALTRRLAAELLANVGLENPAAADSAVAFAVVKQAIGFVCAEILRSATDERHAVTLVNCALASAANLFGAVREFRLWPAGSTLH